MRRANRSAARHKSGDTVEFVLNLEPMIQFLGAGEAMQQSLQDPGYTGAVFETAFEEADEEFNVRAAAYASVTGNISHMYEWGTIGINRGKSNRRPDPMSESARLWKTFNTGRGFNRAISYYFQPSVANVPKPTTGKTGMSQQVISKMRNHVFRWKAEEMEWGRVVTIAPERAKFLLIPVTDANREFARPHDIKRGYMLSRGPISFHAGGNRYANQFTNFWMHFWGDEANDIINRAVMRDVIMDYEPKFTKAKMRSMGLMPAREQNIEVRVQKMQKKIQQEVKQQAKLRRARNK